MELHPIVQQILKRKIILAISAFIIWVSFFDSSNLIHQQKVKGEIKDLLIQRDYYREKITQDSARLIQLRTDAVNFEKFAREQYYMHAPNEDIYVIEIQD